MVKKQYKGQYPKAARYLIEEDITNIARQVEVDLKWASGVDITYTLRGLTPAAFARYSHDLLILAEQEANRYPEYKWKFARFDVRLGLLQKGRDLPEVRSFPAARHDEPEIMIWGPGYDTPQRWFLVDRVKDIIDIAKRYQDKVNKQAPYKVIKLVISIREPR